PQYVTSNASTAMWAPPEVVLPVTVIAKVCVAAARPEAVNTISEASPGLPGEAVPAVSTEIGAKASMVTVAIPQTLQRRLVQLTAVPLKVNVMLAPATSELMAN